MKNHTNTPQKGIGRRTFIKRSSGSLLMFGLGVSVNVANATGWSGKDQVCSGVDTNNDGNDDTCKKSYVGTQQNPQAWACQGVGTPCNLMDNEACAKSWNGGNPPSKVLGGGYCVAIPA